MTNHKEVMDGASEPTRQSAYTTPRPDVFAMVPANVMSVLDVGCSDGSLGASLRCAREGRRVSGVEGDSVFAAEAALHLDRVIQADINTMQWGAAFPDTRFDCIVFADVLEHLVNPREQLRNAQTCLQPGGCLVISLPNIRHISSLYSIFVKGTFPQRDRGIFDRTHLRWFTIRDAKQMIADAGLKIEAISYSLRVRDRGDGTLNRIARRVLEPVERFAPVHQFLSYQFCIRAVKP